MVFADIRHKKTLRKMKLRCLFWNFFGVKCGNQCPLTIHLGFNEMEITSVRIFAPKILLVIRGRDKRNIYLNKHGPTTIMLYAGINPPNSNVLKIGRDGESEIAGVNRLPGRYTVCVLSMNGRSGQEKEDQQFGIAFHYSLHIASG